MSINSIYLAAAKKAERIRIQLGMNSFEPVNVFDISGQLDVTVRFCDINMEGMYISQTTGKFPTILLSNQRPMPRRVYNCAHELGHHLFGHGSRIDMLTDHKTGTPSYNPEERLVDTFAGILLMPIASIQAEFNRREWTLASATQINYYVISCFFGVGYQTLIKHCELNNLISESKSNALLKTTPAKLLKSIDEISLTAAPFKMFDGVSVPKTIDLEVNNYLFMPTGSIVEGDHLQPLEIVEAYQVYVTKKPGVVRVINAKYDFGAFLRIQHNKYVGLAENRHLEND